MKFTNHHVSDIVIRLKNALLRGHSEVVLPNVNIVRSIILILKTEGFITDFKVEGLGIKVALKYYDNRPVISSLKAVSKPSKRVYASHKSIPSYYNGLGITIISTSKGVMTDIEAVQKSVGGEVLCQVF